MEEDIIMNTNKIEFKDLDPRALFNAIHGICSPMKFIGAYYSPKGVANKPAWFITSQFLGNENHVLVLCENTPLSFRCIVENIDVFINKYKDKAIVQDHIWWTDHNIQAQSNFTPTEGYQIISFLKEHNIQADY